MPVHGLKNQTPPFRPTLQTSLENVQAFVRTPYSMTQHTSLALDHAGPSTLAQARSKELLNNVAPPAWYGVEIGEDDEEARLEAAWWTMMSRDEAYIAGLPAAPTMLPMTPAPKPRIPRRKRSPAANGHSHLSGEISPPPLEYPKAVNLEDAIHRNVDRLNEARNVMGLIHDWQRIEAEGGVLPPNPAVQQAAHRAQARSEREERKRARREEDMEASKRRRLGGEVGEQEATQTLKKASAGLLAHAGFEGQYSQ